MHYRAQAMTTLTVAWLVLGGFSQPTLAHPELRGNLLGQVAPVAPPDLLKVRLTGGLCVPKLCDVELVMQRNGNYQYFQGEEVKATGKLRRREVIELKRLIQQADFAAIVAQPFQGTCPIAYDGSKTIYTFFAQGQPAEVIDDCDVAVDVNQPLFRQTNAMLERIRAAANN